MGKLKAYYRFWDWSSDTFTLEHNEVPLRDCTLEELGLDPPEESGESRRRLADDEEDKESEESKSP